MGASGKSNPLAPSSTVGKSAPSRPGVSSTANPSGNQTTTAIDSIKKSSQAATISEAAVISAAGQTSQTAPVTHKRSQMEADFDRFRAYDKLEDGVDAIGPKGFAQLCGELGIGASSPDSFVLSWSLGATQSLCITRSEWMHAAHLHKLDHLGTLKARLKEWQAAGKDESAFSEMYNSVYDFIRGDDEKLLPLEKAIKVWTVLLSPDLFPLISQWTTWCAVEFKRPVSRDIWRQIWEFARRTKQLSEYDPNDKWPTALDDFVEFLKEKGVTSNVSGAANTTTSDPKKSARK